MTHKGFSHLGLSTRDLDSTRDFYENVLGFKVAFDIIRFGRRSDPAHLFDTGRDQLIAFMEPQGVAGFLRTTMQALMPELVSQVVLSFCL